MELILGIIIGSVFGITTISLITIGKISDLQRRLSMTENKLIDAGICPHLRHVNKKNCPICNASKFDKNDNK